MTSDPKTEWTPGPWSVRRGDGAWRGFTVIVAPTIPLAHSPVAVLSNVQGPEECAPDARLIAASPALYEALASIVDESVFNQQRFAEDTDTDYFLRCFRAVKERARAALSLAHPQVHEAK